MRGGAILAPSRRLPGGGQSRIRVMASLHSVVWTYLAEGAVRIGDIVSADAGGMPIYRVVGVTDGRATLRDLERSTVQTLPLARLHWKAAATKPYLPN